MIADAREQSPTPRWACDHGRYVTGTPTDRDFLAAYARYNFNDGSAEKITCPVLVCEATADLFCSADEESDPRKLYRHLISAEEAPRLHRGGRRRRPLSPRRRPPGGGAHLRLARRDRLKPRSIAHSTDRPESMTRRAKVLNGT
ncbi:hypothetical protein J2Z21_007307 [Streptomyces griseochromogenes]|uniref:Uncharacterized protein n=1 Tax=Streptomyces griseochromogenes TaxID=68214 RepID=A0ABS4M4G1_9ACTN|nr:hypothetical protein [Streptomyces griseochromogenes]MBP2054304.1 hypothetical protein [Streptomyces griseochromogenes]